MSQRRSALGRGLGALISTPPEKDARTDPSAEDTPSGVDTSVRPLQAASETRGPQEIAIDLIDPNPEQPRREFDEAGLRQLARSIGQHGVLQPVVVRQAGSRFELIMGERRFRASQLAGRRTIPVVVADVAPADRLELAIVENVQRQDLNPIELAHAYQALSDAGYTQDEIGQRVSMDRSSIANHIRLLDLSRSIQGDVEAGRITMGHAKALLQVGDETLRETLRSRILRESLSVRAAEGVARELSGKTSAPRKASPAAADPELDADTRAFVERIEHQLQTRVVLRRGSGDAGKLEIHYFNLEDLERLGTLLLGETT